MADLDKPVAGSQADLISLQELDPSPEADDSPVDISRSEYFPRSAGSANPAPSSGKQSPPRAAASSLGLSGHGVAWWLIRIQRYSSYTFSLFLTMHYTNVALIPLIGARSAADADPYLLLTRPYYQSPLMEPLLILAPLAAHIGSGVALRVHRRRQSLRWYGEGAASAREDRRRLAWPRLSGTSVLGYALLPMLAAHAAANRILPLVVDGGSSAAGLKFFAHSVARFPTLLYLAYSVMVPVATAHFVWGAAQWLGLAPASEATSATAEGSGAAGWGGDAVSTRESRRRRRWGINAVTALVAGVWLAGGLGVVARSGLTGGWLGRHYDELLRHLPILGNWL